MRYTVKTKAANLRSGNLICDSEARQKKFAGVQNGSGRSNNKFSKNYILRTFSIFIVAILLVIHDSSAQEREYIVTNNHDTIYGKVSRSLNLLNTSSEIKFLLKDENGNKSSINPAEVKIIRSFNGVDGDSFIATAYDQWFAKRIIDGKIKVYLSLNTALFYTSKNNSDLQYTEFGGFTSRKKAHALIRPLIEDNPVILKEFDTLKGSEANILYIIEKYNSLEIQ